MFSGQILTGSNAQFHLANLKSRTARQTYFAKAITLD